MTDKACLKCGKLAVNPPLCLNCLLDSTADEFDKWLTLNELIIAPDYDEKSECKMCGKPTADGRPDGFCGSCRQVWNG